MPSGRLVCVHPEVNIPTPAFLAGNHAIARSCLLERGARRGACGPEGLCWEPRPDDRAGFAPVDRLNV